MPEVLGARCSMSLIICVHDNIIQCQKRLKEARRLKRNLDRRILRARDKQWIRPKICSCCDQHMGRSVADKEVRARLDEMHVESCRLWNLVEDLEAYIKAIKLIDKGMPK